MSETKHDDFDAFMRGVSPRLLALGWLLTSDRAAAEDLVQESLARTYAVWWRIRTEHASAYTRRVLVNLHRETWRKHGRERPHAEVPEAASNPERAVDESRHLDLVDALQRLAPREREAVVLRHYLDLSERESAEAMRCSVGNVKSRTSRGLARLRELLDVDAQEGERHAHL